MAEPNLTDARIVDLAPQPTAAIRVQQPMAELDLKTVFDQGLPRVMAAIQAAGQYPAGPPFGRYHRFGPDIVVGVPGVADPQKLLNVAARIGVKDARRFLVKNLRFVTGMARSGGFYKPTGFVRDLAPLLADPAAKVTGFHLYTFNAVEATEAWRRSMLDGTG